MHVKCVVNKHINRCISMIMYVFQMLLNTFVKISHLEMSKWKFSVHFHLIFFQFVSYRYYGKLFSWHRSSSVFSSKWLFSALKDEFQSSPNTLYSRSLSTQCSSSSEQPLSFTGHYKNINGWTGRKGALKNRNLCKVSSSLKSGTLNI